MDIKGYKSKIENTHSSIRKDISKYFKEIKYTLPNKSFQTVAVSTPSDFEKILKGSGFYIIFTDFKIEEQNKCVLEIDSLKAIYRGHGSKVCKRLQSHLINKIYRSKRKSSDPDYSVCLKIKKDGTKGGININSEPYKSSKWKVVVHKMTNSSKEIREQAEFAFDEVFGKPVCSREVNKLPSKKKRK